MARTTSSTSIRDRERSALLRQIELPSDQAPIWWPLTGWGGPIQIRGWDPSDSWIQTPGETAPFGYEALDRWGWVDTLVPTQDDPRAPGPSGPLRAGDCVIYVTPDAHGEVTEAWFPQRVVAAIPAGDGWQRVLTLGDRFMDMWSHEPSKDLPSDWVRQPILSTTDRRQVLHRFSLAVDCPMCGSLGAPIAYGLPAGPFPPGVVMAGCVIGMDGLDPQYECPTCSAEWVIATNGDCYVLTHGSRPDDSAPGWVKWIDRRSPEAQTLVKYDDELPEEPSINTPRTATANRRRSVMPRVRVMPKSWAELSINEPKAAASAGATLKSNARVFVRSYDKSASHRIPLASADEDRYFLDTDRMRQDSDDLEVKVGDTVLFIGEVREDESINLWAPTRVVWVGSTEDDYTVIRCLRDGDLIHPGTGDACVPRHMLDAETLALIDELASPGQVATVTQALKLFALFGC